MIAFSIPHLFVNNAVENYNNTLQKFQAFLTNLPKFKGLVYILYEKF